MSEADSIREQELRMLAALGLAGPCWVCGGSGYNRGQRCAFCKGLGLIEYDIADLQKLVQFVSKEYE